MTMRFQTLINETKPEVEKTIKYKRKGADLDPIVGPDSSANEWTSDFQGAQSNFTYKYTESGSLLSYA